MALSFILLKPFGRKSEKPTNFDKFISWVTQGKPCNVESSFSTMKDLERGLDLLEQDTINRFPKPYVALVAERSESGYCLAYGFVSITKNEKESTQPHYFQYEEPRRFEDSSWEGFNCMSCSKPGEPIKGSFVANLNTQASAQDYKKQFFALHQEFLRRDKQSFFGFFRRTEIKPQMSLEEIVQHAEKKSNRSREVLVHMGLMTDDGKKTKLLEHCLSEKNIQGRPS